jgi:transposase InsO family protein
LRDAGWRISKNTVADSMRRQGLVARARKRRRGLTRADRRAGKPVDLLQRDFAPPGRINQRWVSDLTEIDTGEAVLYLASILDLRSRRAIGYALGGHHDADLAAAAVQVAIATRGGDVAAVVLHTDQGGEFSGGALTRLCTAAGISRDHPVPGSYRVGPGQRRGRIVSLHPGSCGPGSASPPGPRPAAPSWRGSSSTTPTGSTPPTG